MKTKNIVYLAIFIALGLVLPIGLHFFGPALGSVISPMHIPVFLAGAILGPAAGLIAGAVTPVLSSLLTGMPPVMPILPIMFLELALYGLITGYFFHTRGRGIYFSLLTGMIAGRIGVGIVVWLLVNVFGVAHLPANPLIFVWGSIAKGLPGIILQLILVPLVVQYLKKYQGNLAPENRLFASPNS